jgi:hypothetical protein
VTARQFFSFPNPVNEKAARSVAAGALILSLLTITTGWLWLTIPLAYGFVARLLTGPTMSPLGQLATRVVAPRLGQPKPVPGPPKRFAQGIGATLSVAALLFWALAGWHVVPLVLVGLIAVAAFLESVLAICLGCIIFGFLMRWGVIPETVCESCANVSGRIAAALAAKEAEQAAAASQSAAQPSVGHPATR